MSNLFKRAMVFTDIHFGAKSNSTIHNTDCEEFVKWSIKTAKEHDCDTCFFLGDYHNNRSTVNVLTLSYALRGLEHLSQNFDQVFFINGNHDLFFRNKREVYSAEWAKHLPNVRVVNDILNTGDVLLCPWLIDDEFSKIPKLNAKYVFGHFELPLFYMNSLVQMPDHGELKREHFGHFGEVFSGHFHKRQTFRNITYIGNAFPHNYSDAGDDERGIMILEWGSAPKFVAWPDQPKFRVYNLSNLINDTENLLKPNMHVRVNIDVDISYEEANFIKETFSESYDIREISLLPIKNTDYLDNVALGNVQFQSVDSIVTQQLTNIQSENFDPKLLLDIYRNL